MKRKAAIQLLPQILSFLTLARAVPRPPGQSFFASFCSQKEGLSFWVWGGLLWGGAGG
jgi:hypothetical protein